MNAPNYSRGGASRRRTIPNPLSSASITISPDSDGTRTGQEAGLKNVTFAAAKSTDYPGKDYEFVAHFDRLHDVGDPVGAAKHVKKTVTQDGT